MDIQKARDNWGSLWAETGMFATFRPVRVESQPQELRIIEERPGRGGRVQIPLSRVTLGVIANRTAGGGEGTFDLDRAMFQDVVDNFGKTPGPVPVYFGHIPAKDRVDTPAVGFIESVHLEGDFLWGTLDLGPRAWSAVVSERGFRSFSVEIDFDKPIPTGEIPGFSLDAGAITNTPALDVEFIAASVPEAGKPARIQLSAAIHAPHSEPLEEIDMDLAKIKAAVEQKIRALSAFQSPNEEQVKELALQRATLAALAPPAPAPVKADTKAAEAMLALTKRVTDMEQTQATLVTENHGLKNTLAERKVLEIASKAIAAGKSPKFFDGHTENPVKWLEDRFGGSLAALEASVDVLEVRKLTDPKVKSGGGSTHEDGDIMAATHKLAAEKGIPFVEAMKLARAANPEKWAEISQTYADKASPSGN